MRCPECGSNHTIKNGKDPNRNQRYLCKECGRNFVSSATTASQKVSWYQNKKTIIWIIVIVALIFFSFTGWFGLALLLSAIVWLWVYKKHPAQSAAESAFPTALLLRQPVQSSVRLPLQTALHAVQ